MQKARKQPSKASMAKTLTDVTSRSMKPVLVKTGLLAPFQVAAVVVVVAAAAETVVANVAGGKLTYGLNLISTDSFKRSHLTVTPFFCGLFDQTRAISASHEFQRSN
jgi:hypothetical protein